VQFARKDQVSTEILAGFDIKQLVLMRWFQQMPLLCSLELD
jgi:hypothetical protein